jgi:hypothetical protein
MANAAIVPPPGHYLRKIEFKKYDIGIPTRFWMSSNGFSAGFALAAVGQLPAL